ncbi:uncharacterized protein LOC111871502 [Cryptotermes secundus]|uniref:uncharacterized protein LOC111871502 n=1 Tax=Cryptotermes secundus TaxID=105785 RepID=UPI000CD7B71F|nr:uncharacterized protein LOC111871502 [Cryptotermes secundus]
MHIRQTVSLLLALTLTQTAAQRCLSVPCGKLQCANVTCVIDSQADCRDGETYLYPGLVCECCGACVSRSGEKGAQCPTRVLNSHVSGCISGLCCSLEGTCVEKTVPFGA